MRFLLVLSLLLSSMMSGAQTKQPFAIAIDGLTHAHVHWILGRAKDGDIKIVGIAEKNRELAERYLKQYNLPISLLYPSLTELLKSVKPEAVAAFNPISEHLSTVQACAPKGIHVMVEKPLAVSLAHAKEMEALSKKHNIHLLTNYETTWYGSHYRAQELLDTLGAIRKVVVHDGHQGPKEIGVNKEFLDWLTDPVTNGGGAITDFGCYGANLMTWLMKGERPTSVMAVTQQIKPEVYPKVDDEATIVVTYPKAQAIIQASWNWPYSRKDIEIYGQHGYVIADKAGIRVRPSERVAERTQPIPVRSQPYHDPFAYLAAVVRGEIKMADADPSALANNMVVMEILEAAKQSAKEGRRIELK
ncbi:Gfo/Idh/MocA family oxidoreductase [Flavisolibacter sp. BT320]|nr:Gfo/Idh/MocA family oxidoreductase [Flavisolibacter longurius]